jgi:hypothetical protein
MAALVLVLPFTTPGAPLIDLGPLAAFSGEQTYPVPRGVDPRLYGSVVIWSEHFNRVISPAPVELLTPVP